MLQAARHTAAEVTVVVSDDTDVFTLLLHFRHAGVINASNIYIESPMKGRAVIDVDATVQENLTIIPSLLAAHVLSGCDTVASYFGIGKGVVLKVLKAGNHVVKHLYIHIDLYTKCLLKYIEHKLYIYILSKLSST